METSPQQTARNPVKWSHVALLTLIALVSLFSLAIAVFDFIQGAVLLVQGDPVGATALFIVTAGSLARILLLLPAAYYALIPFAGGKTRHLASEAVPSWTILAAWAGAVALGALVLKFDLAPVLFIPPLSVVVTLLPLWLIARLATRHLDTGSDLRGWGSFGLGTTVGPFLSTLLEGGFVILLAALFGLAVLSSPTLRDSLLQLASRLQTAPTEQALLRLLLPVLLDRRVVFVVVLVLCVVTPIIEEAFKPIAVWLGAGRIITPAQGFALGALCGAGFAAFESLMAVASAGEDWAAIIILRTGTGIMHTANAALMGWALVLAWREKRYLRLALVYLGVILVHGSWNLLALSYGLSSLPSAVAGIASEFKFQAPYALPALALISVAMLAILILMNRHLVRPPDRGLTVAGGTTPDPGMQV